MKQSDMLVSKRFLYLLLLMDIDRVWAGGLYCFILRLQGLQKEAGGGNRHGNNVAESDELWGLQHPPISCDAIHSNF